MTAVRDDEELTGGHRATDLRLSRQIAQRSRTLLGSLLRPVRGTAWATVALVVLGPGRPGRRARPGRLRPGPRSAGTALGRPWADLAGDRRVPGDRAARRCAHRLGGQGLRPGQPGGAARPAPPGVPAHPAARPRVPRALHLGPDHLPADLRSRRVPRAAGRRGDDPGDERAEHGVHCRLVGVARLAQRGGAAGRGAPRGSSSPATSRSAARAVPRASVPLRPGDRPVRRDDDRDPRRPGVPARALRGPPVRRSGRGLPRHQQRGDPAARTPSTPVWADRQPHGRHGARWSAGSGPSMETSASARWLRRCSTRAGSSPRWRRSGCSTPPSRLRSPRWRSSPRCSPRSRACPRRRPVPAGAPTGRGPVRGRRVRLRHRPERAAAAGPAPAAPATRSPWWARPVPGSPRWPSCWPGSTTYGPGACCWTASTCATLDPAELRRAVVMVTQEAYLFSGSVAANIALGRPDAHARAEIEDAARAVGVHQAGRLVARRVRHPGRQARGPAVRGPAPAGLLRQGVPGRSRSAGARRGDQRARRARRTAGAGRPPRRCSRGAAPW